MTVLHLYNTETNKFLLTCLLRDMTARTARNPVLHVFLLTCLLRDMTHPTFTQNWVTVVSTHMPLARHDLNTISITPPEHNVSTHMPLARHDIMKISCVDATEVSTHMPLARHDVVRIKKGFRIFRFYSHASCET